MPDDPNLTIKFMEEIASSLRELVNISRIVSFSYIKEKLENTLNTKEKRLVYLAMDGNNTVSEIVESTNVNRGTISEWGQEWEKFGLVENCAVNGVKGRRKKIFDLSIYGLSATEVIVAAPSDNLKA